MFSNGILFGLGLFVSFLIILIVIGILVAISSGKKKYDYDKLLKSFEEYKLEILKNEEYEKVNDVNSMIEHVKSNKYHKDYNKFKIKKKHKMEWVEMTLEMDFYYDVKMKENETRK